MTAKLLNALPAPNQSSASVKTFASLSKAQKEITELKKSSISSIQNISENITSNIIENISGDKLNESSIKATVDDVSKKSIGKYL